VEENTAQAMLDLKHRLSLISRERIAQELLRMVISPAAAQVLRRFESIFFAAMPDCAQPDIAALAALPGGDATARMAALLHLEGAEKAAAALQSLKTSALFTRECLELVTYYDAALTARDVPLWLSRLGEAQFRRLLFLQHNTALLPEIDRALAENLPLRIRDLAVNGRDLIDDGVPPGPMVGEILTQLHQMVLRRELPNERDALMTAGKKLHI